MIGAYNIITELISDNLDLKGIIGKNIKTYTEIQTNQSNSI